MQLTEKLSGAFNDQIKAEMWSSNLYLQMAVHLADMGLDGCAHWLKRQAAEELEHVHKMIDFSIMRGGKVTIGAVEAVPAEWESPQALFQHVYDHECQVSKMIDNLMDLAVAEGDKAAQEFLRWFINEQVEEEDTAKGILDKFHIYGVHGLFYIDKALGKRE